MDLPSLEVRHQRFAARWVRMRATRARRRLVQLHASLHPRRPPCGRTSVIAAAKRRVSSSSSSASASASEPLLAVPADRYEAYIPPITAHYSGQGFEPYQWHVADEATPRAPPPPRPLSECRLGVLCTSGAYVSGEHLAYCYKDDATIRHIRSDARADELRFSHLTENYLVAGRSDPSCLVPVDALRTLVSARVLGEIAPATLSCMGGIYSVRRVQEELIPAVVSAFQAQGVDAALLVPM